MTMTATWWCEHAWLGGDTVADAACDRRSTDGRITARHAGHAARRREPRCAGLVIPGLANAHSHAFHRALRGRTQRDRGSFWTWRELMYARRRPARPRRLPALARAVYAEMALAGITAVGEFHYLHHDAGGAPYADPNAMGHALIEAAARRRHPADAAGHLLPELRRGRRAAGRGACSSASATAAATLGPSGSSAAPQAAHRRRVIVGAAVHSVRAVPRRPTWPPSSSWADARGAPLHVHSVGADRRERRSAWPCTAHAHARCCADAAVLGPRTTAVHATHLTDERHRRPATRTATGVCFCPTTERDLGDGIGPAPALLAGGGPVQPRLGQPRGDRPVRGGAGRRARRTACPARARPARRAATAGGGDRRRPAGAGLVRRGRASARLASRPGGRRPGLDPYRRWRRHRRDRRVRRQRRRCHRRGRRRTTVVVDRAHVDIPDTGAVLAAAIAAVMGTPSFGETPRLEKR